MKSSSHPARIKSNNKPEKKYKIKKNHQKKKKNGDKRKKRGGARAILKCEKRKKSDVIKAVPLGG